jgi:hypothetical protein
MVPADPLTPKTPWLVRELVYDTASDMVDVNCDHTLGNDLDQCWEDFLPYWNNPRVKYADAYTANSSFDLYQLGQAIVLEIKGWMWFHQPGDHYTVIAKASTAGGATSNVLNGGNKMLWYNRVIGLYIDFDSVNYGPVEVGGTSWDMGDRFLTTPGQPTAWNNGNASAQVLVASTKMVKDYTGNSTAIYDDIYYDSDAKTITHFDARLYFCDGDGAVVQVGEIDYVADAAPALITTANPHPVLLQACRPAKIEFSVEPELNESQEAGTYRGFLTVSVAPYTGAANQQVEP